MKILVLNSGSSTQKNCLYDLDPDQLGASFPTDFPTEPILQGRGYANEPIWSGTIDWLHKPDIAECKAKGNGQEFIQHLPNNDRQGVLTKLLASLYTGETQVIEDLAAIDIVGHRVVHGGDRYSQPVLITPEVEGAIEELISLAPAHNPANLEGIKIIRQALPDVPQVAVFDTAFHQTLPAAAAVYPLPYDLFQQGIRRYGFHGISHQYCSDRAAQILGQPLENLRLINCHLGNGCSLAAIANGVSVDTTMGFTPLEGLMMGSRSGSVDPGILLYLSRQGYSTADLDDLLHKRSGLLGVSGVSSDLRRVLGAIEEGNTQAQLALDVYIHRLSAGIAALVPSLGGLEALVFTGGVGEHSPIVRQLTCDRLAFLGIAIDAERNYLSNPQNSRQQKERDIATPNSAVRVLIIQTQEDWSIAKACWTIQEANSDNFE